MAEETAEEAAQRVNTKRLAANREVRKESMPRNHKNSVKMGLRLKEKLPKNLTEASQEQRENRLAVQRDNTKRKRADESQEQRENRLAAQRDNAKGKRAEESQEQRENKLATQRDNVIRKRTEESQEQRENFRLAFR